MSSKNQENGKSTHVRVYPDKKERVAKIVRKLAYNENRTVYEIDIIDQVLDQGLPKLEKRLGL